MAPVPDLIFCGGGNATFAAIALDAGFRYGCRLPTDKPYAPIWFADQDWKRPARERYMRGLASWRPTLATVIDWEHAEQFSEVLDWAEEAAQYVDRVLIVPKVIGEIERIPRTIGGKQIVLGYSVPTTHGGTQLPLWEFAGWPVHLLGGSPQVQMQYWLHLSAIADVVSIDGNTHQRMATQHCRFWLPGTATGDNRYWQRLQDAGYTGPDAPAEAFKRSCQQIWDGWNSLV